MKFRFGVMSSVWTMEAVNQEIAEVAMCVFMRQNIPIVIYEPEKKAISPLTVFENADKKYGEQKPIKEIQEAVDSIKEEQN